MLAVQHSAVGWDLRWGALVPWGMQTPWRDPPLPSCMALWRGASPTQVDEGGPLLLEDPVWQNHRAQLPWTRLKKGKGTSFTGMCP